MKKYDKKEFHLKSNTSIQKKNYSIDNNFHGKMDNFINQKSSDDMECKNQNITNINNINIVNMIMSKEKPYKYKNISKNDLSKSKTHKLLLYSNYNHSKFIQNLKKKNSLIKIKQKNRSCRQLSNIKINLYNNKFIDKNRQKNYFISDDEHSSSLNQKSDFIKIEGRIRKKINPKELEGNSKNAKNIDLKKNKNIPNNKIFEVKDLLSDSNLNIESENKEYLDSEMNFRNKQEKNDYEKDKDIEYLNVNIPYTIKVNLNKKIYIIYLIL